MNQVKKITLLLLVLGLTSAFVQAATQEKEKPKQETGKPDATLRFSGGAVAIGIGYSWGKGTLIYKGKEYPVSVNGLSLGKVGITGATASGEVYHLKTLQDFDGNYTAAGAGITLAGGRSAVTMKNQHGVRVRLVSTTRGADVTLGAGGVDLKIKK
jgi:hypothetical protein